MSSPPKPVSVVVLTWNNFEDTRECLVSLFGQDSISLDIVVVDNGSEDGSPERIFNYIEKEFGFTPKQLKYRKTGGYEPVTENNTNPNCDVLQNSCKSLTLIRNDRNYGFGAGCNVGIMHSLRNFAPEYVVVANNDTQAEKSLMNELVDFMDSDQSIGIAGPIIEWGADISVSHAKRYLRATSGGKAFETNISGAFLILRARALHQMGLFDEDYFLFFEETNLFKRCRTAGFRVVLAPTTSKVFHKSSISVKLMGNAALYHLGRSASIYLRKNHSFEFVSFFVSSVLRSVLLAGNVSGGLHLVKGIADGCMSGREQ